MWEHRTMSNFDASHTGLPVFEHTSLTHQCLSFSKENASYWFAKTGSTHRKSRRLPNSSHRSMCMHVNCCTCNVTSASGVSLSAFINSWPTWSRNDSRWTGCPEMSHRQKRRRGKCRMIAKWKTDMASKKQEIEKRDQCQNWRKEKRHQSRRKRMGIKTKGKVECDLSGRHWWQRMRPRLTKWRSHIVWKMRWGHQMYFTLLAKGKLWRWQRWQGQGKFFEFIDVFKKSCARTIIDDMICTWLQPPWGRMQTTMVPTVGGACARLILGISTKGYYQFDIKKPRLDLRTLNDVKFWLLSYWFRTSIKLKLN